MNTVFISCHNYIICISERNTLSFIETSALDSTNVEAAFTNILTGELFLVFLIEFTDTGWDTLCMS